MRTHRGRLVLAAFASVLALIGALYALARGGHRRFSPIDPGPLTVHHAVATSAQGCAACHTPSDVGSSGWLRAVVTSSAPAGQCLACHAFGGPPTSAHNTRFEKRPDMNETACVACHTEHHGAAFDMTQMSDAQCNACHAVKFASFTDGHPEFPERFPYEERTAIVFDHHAHLSRYFNDPRLAAQAPQSCTSCHAVQSTAERSVPIGRFEQTCARCHASDLSSRDLVLFRFPALTGAPIDPTLVRELCGSAPAAGAASEEDPTPISGFLLGVETKSPEAYSEPMQRLVLAMAKDGVAPLADALDRRAGSPVSPGLLAGLNPEVVRQAACAWIANQEYSPLEGAALGGWHAEAFELRYTPTMHADPVARRWIEFAAQEHPQGEPMRREVLSRTRGVGACLKCHAPPKDVGGESGEWTSGPKSRPLTAFSHSIHLSVLGGAQACATCHVVNPQADVATMGNFRPITKAACTQCHGASPAGESQRLIRQDCLLCHRYHREQQAPAARRNLTSFTRPGKRIPNVKEENL